MKDENKTDDIIQDKPNADRINVSILIKLHDEVVKKYPELECAKAFKEFTHPHNVRNISDQEEYLVAMIDVSIENIVLSLDQIVVKDEIIETLTLGKTNLHEALLQEGKSRDYWADQATEAQEQIGLMSTRLETSVDKCIYSMLLDEKKRSDVKAERWEKDAVELAAKLAIRKNDDPIGSSHVVETFLNNQKERISSLEIEREEMIQQQIATDDALKEARTICNHRTEKTNRFLGVIEDLTKDRIPQKKALAGWKLTAIHFGELAITRAKEVKSLKVINKQLQDQIEGLQADRDQLMANQKEGNAPEVQIAKAKEPNDGH